MEYHSTAGKTGPVDLKTAIVNGLAPDGGLYIPARLPRLPRAFFNNMPEMTISEIAYVVANTLFGDDIDSATLKHIVDDALNFDMPLVDLGDGLNGIELFHGPTHSFKDVGTRFMSRIMGYFNINGTDAGNKPYNVIVATSGNGGSAVAVETMSIPGVHTFVLYPAGKLSPAEEAQFSTIGGRIHAIEVAGSFDECQALSARLINDADIRSRMNLLSANSVNIVQLLPQVFYYFYAYGQLVQCRERVGELVMGVPSGNLGNLAGGVAAKQMGLPIKRFVTAGNHFVLSHFIADRARGLIDSDIVKDVSASANFHRIIKMYGDSISRLTDDVATYHCTDDDVADTINKLYRTTGYLTEPNAASVIRVMRDELRETETGIVLLPTHPAKKAETINFITGQCVNIPHDLADVLKRPRHMVRIPASYATVKKLILQTLG